MSNSMQSDRDVAWPDLPCACDYGDGCICLPMERALRHATKGSVALTSEQRETCLAEIAKVEGWDRADHQGQSDRDLARSTLGAWADYCRDRSLL